MQNLWLTWEELGALTEQCRILEQQELRDNNDMLSALKLFDFTH